ncbi:MAG: hypothetical protein ABI411_21010 [Tahibacter sp.]
MTSYARKFAFLLAAALIAPLAGAADGQLDATFGTDAEYPGYGFYPNPLSNGVNDSTTAIASAPDGSLYQFGRLIGPGGIRLAIRKHDTNGYPIYDFGDAGLRTYVKPCADASLSDGKIDAQGRIWISVGGCDDFMVFRFLPNGDPDVSLLGGGVASIAFDRGGTNKDNASKLLLLPNGGFVVAGWVATPTNTHVGVAQFTAAGLPDPTFGVGGKAVMPVDVDAFFVNGLHRMDDGRLMIDGTLAGGSVRKHFVVRLQPSGAPDVSFGSNAAGLSMYDFKTALNLVDSAYAADSWMERDGSLIQVGDAEYTNFPKSSSDIFIVRWRSDGLRDTTFGPFGARRYALDYAGANPANVDNNNDQASKILREGNGRYLIVANSAGPEGEKGLVVMRLKHNLDLDTSYASGGKVRHFVDISASTAGGSTSYGALLQSGRLVATANVSINGLARTNAAVGVQEDVLFANDFE